MPNTVSPERTGWRDEGLSRRHRQYGFDCPGVDIDFLLIEYDYGKACAIVDYKRKNPETVKHNHPNVKAMVDLGNRANIPVFITFYAKDFSWFYPVPVNKLAGQYFPENKIITEREWVILLYRMRGRELPQDLHLWD